MLPTTVTSAIDVKLVFAESKVMEWRTNVFAMLWSAVVQRPL
jgi:hypothetical protein